MLVLAPPHPSVILAQRMTYLLVSPFPIARRTILTAKYHTIQYNAIQYNTIQYNIIQDKTRQYETRRDDTIKYNTTQHNTIQYNTKNFYISGILCEAKFKGAFKPPSIRQKTHVQRKATFVIKRSGSQLTKENTPSQKVRFYTLPKTSQGFRRRNTQRKLVAERRCTDSEKSRSALSLALRSREETTFVEW